MRLVIGIGLTSLMTNVAILPPGFADGVSNVTDLDAELNVDGGNP
jgi:hypothetical protein